MVCFGCIGDYTTHLCRDYFINHYKDPGSLLNNHVMESKAGFLSWLICLCDVLFIQETIIANLGGSD